MTTRNKSFAGQLTPRIIDTEYNQCNFMQPQPVDDPSGKVGVRIFPGDNTPRTFIDCNLVNVEVPPGSTIQGGNIAIIARNVVTSTEEIVIGGESIIFENLSNFCHGRYNSDTLEIEYRDEVDEIPQPSLER